MDKVEFDFRRHLSIHIVTKPQNLAADHDGGTDTVASNCEGGEDGDEPNLRKVSTDSSEIFQGPMWRFWTNMAMFAVSTFVAGVTMSILTPFYTREAVAKGLNVWQAGMVFGSVFLTQILLMPIFAKYISKIGARHLYLWGLLFSGIANVAFGYLQWVNDASAFLCLSFGIRVASAAGDAAFFAAVYPLATANVGRKFRSTVLSAIETALGVGMMVGPAFGGFLYDLGGFYLPFAVVGGSLLVLCAFVVAFMMDKDNADMSPCSSEDVLLPFRDTRYLDLLGRVAIIVPCLLMLLSEMTLSWFLPSLEPYVNQQFDATSTTTGFLFSLEGVTYAMFSPVWGLLMDAGFSPHVGLAFGAIVSAVGLCVIGPVSFLFFIPKSPYTVGAGLFLIGSGVAATFITTLTYMLSEGAKDLQENEQTRSMITVLWMVAENVGATLGTFFGGLCYDKIGFENGLYIVIGLQCLALAMVPVLRCKMNVCWRPRDVEKRALLNANYLSDVNHKHYAAIC